MIACAPNPGNGKLELLQCSWYGLISFSMCVKSECSVSASVYVNDIIAIGIIAIILIVQRTTYDYNADTGIYILMFERILKRFLRLIIFTILLVSMFALSFHMAFHQFHPFFEKSPFAIPFHALWKTLTMTTGEVGYDSLFRQPSQGSANSKEVPDLPFPEISYILWIAFLVLMPILFTNLLVM